MNRRGLLGLLTGAVATGPKLATGIAEAGARNAITSIPIGGYGYSQPNDTDWRPTRITELKRFLSLGKTDDDRQRERIRRMQMLETAERFRLDGLRSVSPSAKARMLIDSEVARQERLERMFAEQELASLLNPAKW